MKLAIASIVKNEAATLLEWISYHRAVGVKHFIVVDNGSTDGTWELLKQLHRRGVVKTMRFKTLGGQAPQLDAYQLVLNTAARRFDLVAFIDADEYLTPTDGQMSVMPVIEQLFADDNVSAVAMNWACFGSSGAVFKTNELVPERFVKRGKDSFFVNKHYKSIVRPERVSRFKNPHHALTSQGIYATTDGSTLVPDEKHSYGLSQEVCWVGLRVNHYVVKSLEEFLVRKSRVGSAAQPGRIKHQRYFEGHDQNEVTDESILPYMDATRVELSILTQALAGQKFLEAASRIRDELAWKMAGGFYWIRQARLYSLNRLVLGRFLKKMVR